MKPITTVKTIVATEKYAYTAEQIAEVTMKLKNSKSRQNTE